MSAPSRSTPPCRPQPDAVPRARMGAGVRRLPRWLWSLARERLGSTSRVRTRRSLAPSARLAAAVAGVTLSPTSIVLGLDLPHTGPPVRELAAEGGDD